MKWNAFFLIGLFFIVFSCHSTIDSTTYSEIQRKGNKISGMAQSTLLTNVGKAIQKGGPEYAVEFCNLKASAIIDSLNESNNCIISRVTEKNRNPENGLRMEKEKELWEMFQTNSIVDTIIQHNNNLIFYKPIKISLPACLKCHGTPNSEINPATLEKLTNLYPEDLAKGYKLGDLRGLWKIEFSRN